MEGRHGGPQTSARPPLIIHSPRLIPPSESPSSICFWLRLSASQKEDSQTLPLAGAARKHSIISKATGPETSPSALSGGGESLLWNLRRVVNQTLMSPGRELKTRLRHN
ncbi:unnamed protein product [Pleuronectes platessa]|uniref:Uncharacterized protein n=1 Tax=Pleuronectes platessa TaxID=8262 RepID=A0A9N7Z939_PLEPL|nr:unnamed protein product [Pleuronectes platessa]